MCRGCSRNNLYPFYFCGKYGIIYEMVKIKSICAAAAVAGAGAAAFADGV